MAKIAEKAIDTLRENKKLEVAKNRPIKTALEHLEENETLEFSAGGDTVVSLSASDAPRFDFTEAEEEHRTFSEHFIINGFVKKPYGWEIKLVAVDKKTKPRTIWALSKLDPKTNLRLFTLADSGEPEYLTVEAVMLRQKITEAYITKVGE